MEGFGCLSYPAAVRRRHLVPMVGRTVPSAHCLNKHSWRPIGTLWVPYWRPFGACKHSMCFYKILNLEKNFQIFS